MLRNPTKPVPESTSQFAEPQLTTHQKPIQTDVKLVLLKEFSKFKKENAPNYSHLSNLVHALMKKNKQKLAL